MTEPKEGVIPTILGTAVTITGIVLLPTIPMLAAGIIGFGLAHIVLGGIDLIQGSVE